MVTKLQWQLSLKSSFCTPGTQGHSLLYFGTIFIQSHDVCFLLNLLQLILYLPGLSTPSFLMLAIGLTGMARPCCFPVIHSVAKDDEHDVMDKTWEYNLRVYFIEAGCMSWLLLLYVLSTIAHAPSWSKQTMSSTSWSFNGIAGWNIDILGVQGQNDILPWIHSCPLSVLCRHADVSIQSGPV